MAEAFGLAEDDVGVFAQVAAVELLRQQLRGAANAAQRIFDFVGEAADEIAGGVIGRDQRLLAVDAQRAVDGLELQ